MLRILGSPRRLCDGLTRRELLLAGGLGLFAAGLEGTAAAATGTRLIGASRRFGQAKNVIPSIFSAAQVTSRCSI